jgi:hypothetical protein
MTEIEGQSLATKDAIANCVGSNSEGGLGKTTAPAKCITLQIGQS